MFKIILLCIVLCSLSSSTALVAGPKLLIDHDGGADDAMAIFMAILYEKYFNGPKVVGLTTGYGNVKENQTFINSQRFLTVANRVDIPIYRGSLKSFIYEHETDYYFGKDGLGDNENVEYKTVLAQDEHAVLSLIKLSKMYEGDLIVVALGSLTNIALAVSLDPKFIRRLSHLYIGAGNIYSEKYNEPEFNADMDVEAYNIVSQNSLADKVTVVPFSQIYQSQNITKQWRMEELGAIPTEMMRIQNAYERISIETSDMWVLLDPAVMAIVLKPSMVTQIGYSANSIILCGDNRGINTNNFTEKSQANVRVILDTDEEIYKTVLYDIFTAELKTDCF